MSVPLHPAEENLLEARRFVDFLNARYKEQLEKSEEPRKTYVAFCLGGVSVVAARETAGKRLEEFVAGLGGKVEAPRLDGKRAA